MNEDITILEDEKLAMQLMESFDNPSDEDIASLDVDGCAQASKDLLDMQMVLEKEKHAVDVEALLHDFHVRKRRILVRRLLGTFSAAAVLAGLLFFLFGGKEEQAKQPTMAKVDYIYKADSTIYNKVEKLKNYGEAKSFYQVVTPHGTTKTVHLSDGTEVMLNAGSRLVYPKSFGKESRVVQLYGEAFFKVRKDDRHPFVVKSGSINTTVLGTQFDVRNYGVGAPTVVLVEGKVMLTDSLGRKPIMMKPGQSATLNQHGDFALAEETDLDESLSWKDGYLYYDDISLEKMMNEIGWWYNVDVVCKNPTAKKSRVHMYVPNKQSLEKTVEMINKLNVAHVTIEGKQIIVR